MAKSLNKSRMKKSKIIIIFVLFLVFFTEALISYEAPLHKAFDFLGFFFLAICAMGRLYSTAFLGGFKNDKLITHGAFSIVRNPLYFFSLIGMTGVAFVSGHLVIIIAMPISFIVLYHFLIKREEEFLLETFGDDYKKYMETTPRLIPNFKLYNAPETVKLVPKYLTKAFKDAIWWFIAYPVLEFAEYLQDSGIITPLFVIP